MGSSLEASVQPITSYLLKGRSVAQEVSRRRPGFHPKAGHMGFVVDNVALEKAVDRRIFAELLLGIGDAKFMAGNCTENRCNVFSRVVLSR
jgi:hypothetical protein